MIPLETQLAQAGVEPTGTGAVPPGPGEPGFVQPAGAR